MALENYNKVPEGFYSEKEEQERKEFVPILRKRILEKLDDLREKIEKNEPYPHGEQEIDSLSDIDDNIETCLNNWYY